MVLSGLSLLFVILLCATSGSTQNQAKDEPGMTAPANHSTSPAPPATLARPQAVDPALEFPPSLPVATFVGPCESSDKTPRATKGCKITLTRTDIDALINTLAPTSPSAVRRQLGLNYSRLAAASAVSESLHLDKNPAVEKQIQMQQKLVRMQVLANALYSQIQAHTNEVVTAEVERYYGEHQSTFVRGDVRRLTIPKSISPDVQPADIAALKTLAESYRARAAAVEDMEQLQQQVLTDLGLKMTVPPTKINMPRPASLIPTERGVFDLEPGQVTPLIDSPNAFTILKLESKQLIPFDIAKPEILTLLQHDRTHDEILKVTGVANAQFNLKYFGLLAPPDILPPPQVAGVAPEQNSQTSFAQRTAARTPVQPRKK